MSTPQISIVTPAFNAASFIAETIQSVQRQTFSAWEHIVVDDGSTDATTAEVERVADSRLRLIRQNNRGQSAAQNRGLTDLHGRFVVMLDADDLLMCDALERLLAVFDAHADATMAFGAWELIDPYGKNYSAKSSEPAVLHPVELQEFLVRNPIISGGAAMIRAADMQAIGGFDTEIRMAQDWECWCRLAARGPVIRLGGAPVFKYRLHPASVSRTDAIDPASQDQAIRRVFGNPEITASLSPRTMKRLRRHREANARYLAGLEALRANDLTQARRLFSISLGRNPGHWKCWLLLAFSGLGHIPAVIRRRVGMR